MADWNTVAAEITRALQGKFLWRFQPGCHIPLSSLRRASLRRADGCREDGEFPSQVESGSSMTNAASPNSQGTIGIFVDLTVPAGLASIYALSPDIHKVAITCHHCIAPMIESSEDPGPIFMHGYPLSNGLESDRSISYPGTGDRSASLDYLDSKIKKLTKRIEQQKNQCHQGLSYDAKSEITQRIKIYKSEKLRTQKTLARCRLLFQTGSINKVLVSSGVHVSNSYSYDLITRALLPSSDGIVSATFDNSCSYHHRHYLQDFAVISLNKNIHAVNVTSPEELVPGLIRTIYKTESPKIDSVVYKHGAASGATQGRVKDYRIVNRFKKETRFGAWRITSQNLSSPFSQEGDSASGVNDKEGRLVGQLHSGFYDGLSMPVTYMNGINDVFRDVKEKMPGIRISLSVPEPSILERIAGGVWGFLGTLFDLTS